MIRPLDSFHMSVFCTAFREHQVILSIDLIQMRSFRITSSAAITEYLALSKFLSGKRIQLTDQNTGTAFLIVCGRGKINLSVIVKQQGWIDAPLVDPHGIRPSLIRFLAVNNEISAAADIGGRHKKPAVMVTQGRRKNSSRRTAFFQRKLLVGGQTVTQQFPVDQVPAVINRHSRKILKR